LADLSGATNDTIGKVKGGGNGFDQRFCFFGVAAKEFAQLPDSALNVLASYAADKFRLTQSKATTSFGNKRRQCNRFSGLSD
jgi:hypothetical protein